MLIFNNHDPRGRVRTTVTKLCVIVSIAFATLSLSWPSFVNGGPFFIADTSGYIRSADAALSTIFGYSSIWSDKRDQYTSVPQTDGLENELGDVSEGLLHPPLIGRSIYYGAFLYGPVLLFDEHGGLLIQSLISAIVIWLILSPLNIRSQKRKILVYIGAIVLLSIASSLPFTVTLMVPDYLTGLACAALAVLLCFWNSYNRYEIAFLSCVIALAALSHSSNLPLLLALSLMALIARRPLGINSKAALIGIGSVVLGFAGEAVFTSAVAYTTGITPIRPPFLTARLIADGPGHEFLKAECHLASFEVCRYADRTPNDSDAFLWSKGVDGVFSTASLRSQRRLSEQDMTFALVTLREYPLETAFSTLQSGFSQLLLMNLDIWRGADTGETFFQLENLPDQVANRMARTLSAKGSMPVHVSEMVIKFVLITSLSGAIIFLISLRVSDDKARRVFAILAFLMSAIVLNAVITGGLSKPDARYNLRIIWLLPLVVYLIGVHLSNVFQVRNDRPS